MAQLDTWREKICGYSRESDRYKPIATVMSHNNLVFNGFGEHTANDFCHYLAIHPLMPCKELCMDDALFARLRKRILDYNGIFHSDHYIRSVSGDCNDDNPFTFHFNANLAYLTTYVLVYRKATATMKIDLYTEFLQSGLLDPEHEIGKLSLSGVHHTY